jgi:eukaryotic-like serine/threonine-protein kinase
VRPLDGSTARLIAGTEGANYPFWSPDSKSIGFFVANKLMRVDLAVGAPLAVCDAAVVRGAAWSSDGRMLIGTMADGLLQVPASGGTPSPLTTLRVSPGDAFHRWPQVLPGGRFLYWVQSAKSENTGTYLASLAKPEDRVLILKTNTNALYAPGRDGKSYLLWMRGATLVAQEFDLGTRRLTGESQPLADPVSRVALLAQMNVAVSAGGVMLYSSSNTLNQFTWLDRAGKPLGLVGEPGEYNIFRLSPDGRRVVAARDTPGEANLWLLDTERGATTRFTFNSTNADTYPIWAPDGRTIVFTSRGQRNLFRKELSGAGNEQRLTASSNSELANDWSRDGRWVLYHHLAPSTYRDLWVLPVTPEGRPAPNATARPYLEGPFNRWGGRFSPDTPPRWIAYQSDETHRYEVYVQAFPEPRGKFQISTAGGQYPHWGAGGRELFYVSPDNKLMVVSLKLGADSVEPSAPRELFPLPVADTGYCPYEATSDGQRFLVRATPKQAGEPLTVIVNWPALLKKGAARE